MANIAINSLNYNNDNYIFTIPYGVCSTAADTAAKTVQVENFSLEEGAVVIVKFTNANSASSPTLNVNGTGAKAIMRYGTTAASTSSSTSGWSAGAVQLLVYDGTNWIREYWNNSTYSNASLGQGYATCTTAAATAAKVASLSSYALSTGGIVSIKFSYDVPANATLNINSKGAKAIWYNGAAITAGIIKAGDIATFMYDGTQYQLISIDIVYKASNGIKLDGDTFKHTNSVTAKTSGSQTTAAPGYGGTFTVMEPLYDAQGHITGTSSATITMPSAQTIPTALKNPNSLTIGNIVYDGSAKKTVTAADLGITGAMLFKGTSSTEVTDGGTQAPTIGGTAVATSNLQAGNVVLYGNQEFVWNGSAWELLGDEGSYSLKGHTHNYAGSSSAGGAATSANKVNSSLSIQLNGGTATVFDGSAVKTINITPAAIGAAASSHGTHVTYSTTAPVVDGTASAGSASTVARSDHKHPTDTTRAAASDLSAHTGNTTVHIINDERTNWNTAYTHSQATHAPTDAEKNQNAFSNVIVGTTTIAADKATDTLTFVAGSNITLTPDATNDKITIEAKDTIYTHPSHTAANSGFYKFAVNSLGHVTSVAAVEKSDITALGIPAQDTTYGAENGIALSSGKFGHTNSVTAKTTYNQSTSAPGYGGTFKITEPIYDAYGHITGSQVATITMPSAQTIPTSFTITANGSGDNVVLLTKSNGNNAVTYNVEHEKMFNSPDSLTTTKYTSGNTSTSITTSGTIKIPQLTVDEYGHVTSASDENVTITMPTALKSPKTLTVGSKSYDGSADITIAASDLGLSNALHFIGVKDSIPTSGTYANGDVILVGKKEYVYSNSAWVELGDESSFALKTITITGNNGLTGSGTLSGNVTLSHADTSSQDSISASGRRYITGVTLDDYGHVTGLTTGTETVTDTHYTTKLFATGSSGTAHAATTNGNTYLRLFDNSTARQSIKIIGSGATTVTSDANGVITISSTDNNTTYTALKNPYALTIQGNGTTLTDGTYDGSAAKTINITPAVIGASPDGHTHDQYLPLTAGEDKKLTGPLGLTKDIMYGPVTPNTGNEFQGQLFFLEDDSCPLPKGGTANQFLVKKSNTDGEAEWKTLTINFNGDVEGTGTFTGNTLDISTYIDGSKHEHNYLPLTGGVVSGNITANNFIGDLQGQADYAAEANYAETALEAESTKKLASDDKELNSVDHFYEANVLKWGSTHSSFEHGAGNIISMGDNLGYGSQIWFFSSPSTDSDIYFRGKYMQSSDSWEPWRKILHTNNYQEYTVTKTGYGATGTWGISISGNASTADKVKNNLTIKLNGGATQDTDLFTFNGSAAKTINITPYAIGASERYHGHKVTYEKATGIGSATATGTISAPTFTGTEHNHTFTGKEHNHTLTPTTATIKQVDNVGTMFAASVEGEVLILTPGSTPTTANVTVYTGLAIAAATQGGTIENTIATGTVSAPTFTGTAHTHDITLTDATVTSST